MVELKITIVYIFTYTFVYILRVKGKHSDTLRFLLTNAFIAVPTSNPVPCILRFRLMTALLSSSLEPRESHIPALCEQELLSEFAPQLAYI